MTSLTHDSRWRGSNRDFDIDRAATRRTRRVPLDVIAVLVVAIAVGAALYLEVDVALVIALAALLALLVVPWPSLAPRWLCLFLAVYSCTTLLPGTLSIAVQLSLVAVTYVVWWRSERRGSTVVFVVTLIAALWMVLLANPNVPDLSTGFLGVRKTTFALVGIVLGCAVPALKRRAVERFVVALLDVVLVVSLVVHFWFPDVEAGISRGADVYTGEFGGAARLQGILPGPFHVAIAAAFVVLWGLLRFRRDKPLAVLSLCVGSVGLSEAAVRTGWVAVVAGLLVLVVIAPTLSSRIRRGATIAGIVLVLVCAAPVIGVGNESLRSLTAGTSDSRFQSRLPTYAEGWRDFERSPIWGWGPGAAGDTLEDRFGSNRVFVTPHSLALKVLVEGGLLGALLWLALGVQLCRRIRFSAQQGAVAAVALTTMGIFALTGSMIEALPVTFLLALLVGMAVDE
jgi:hypothetical protein